MLRSKLNHYILFVILLGSSQLGDAHTIKIFAVAEGDKISGYVYFPGGGRAQQVLVKIESPVLNTQDSVITNSQGEFTYSISERGDYVLTVYTDDGHRAEYTVKANELSESLLLSSSQLEQSQETLVEPVNSTSMPTEEWIHLLEKTVSQQLRPLREQLDRYEAKVRLHDILGGIGYIFGIMGLIFYLGTRKR